MNKYDLESYLAQEKQKLQKANKEMMDAEIVKIKEILDQEFEYKVSQLEEQIKSRELQMTYEVEDQKKAMNQALELEMQKLKVQEQHTKLQTHANTTKEIYADVYKSLEEQFKLESKVKLTEITNKLKQSFET